MEELKEKLASLGIEEEKLDGIVETVVGFLKEKLPPGMEGIVDSIANGETPDLDDLGGVGGVLDSVKGMFGK